jgi:hypothetical protein
MTTTPNHTPKVRPSMHVLRAWQALWHAYGDPSVNCGTADDVVAAETAYHVTLAECAAAIGVSPLWLDATLMMGNDAIYGTDRPVTPGTDQNVYDTRVVRFVMARYAERGVH